jgi:hypothetical protein
MEAPKSSDEEIIEKVKSVMSEGNPSVGINWVLKTFFQIDDRNKAEQIAWKMVLANGEYIINPKPHSEDDIFVVKNPNYKKQSLDLKIAERIVKSYRGTRFIAWAGFAIALILLVLKLSEEINKWLCHK